MREQIRTIQEEKAARTPAERKLSSQLLYLCREATGRQAVTKLPRLKSRAHCESDGRVAVDISANPSPELSDAIDAIGGTVVYESVRWKSVQVVVPPSALTQLASRPDVRRISPASKRIAHTGPVTNEADVAMNVDTSRLSFGVDGSGMKVGVISDSADHYLDSIAAGELPDSFTILPGRSGIGIEGNEGEGTAMAEIVHDLAPGAQIFFAEAGPGKAGFAESIVLLREAGCQLIVDDISYPNEWQFQDDEIGQAINQVVDDGALYFSSSGNEGSLKRGTSTTWEGDFVDGGTVDLLPAGTVHSFGAQNFNRLNDGESSANLQWSDEYHTSSNDYDLVILDADGTSIVSSSTDIQDGSQPPMESIDEVQPGERIVIWKADEAEARYVRLSCTGSPLEIATAGQTIGHAATAKCICVASSDASAAAPESFTTASVVEDSSSDGPHKMFYFPDGTPITPGNFLASGGVTIQSPAITAGDGGATSVPGFEQFYGTSAAAPAAAAVAALVWSRQPGLDNGQLRSLLEASCLDIEDPGFDINSGHGILMADLALTQTLTPQERWRQTNFGTVLPSGDAAPAADPDNDSIPNIVEYATGGDPNAFTANPLIVVSQTGDSVSILYQINPDSTDIVRTFESSTELTESSWTNVIPANDLLVSTDANGTELRSATISKGGVPSAFFRMKVALP
ncbi:MAG: S8 family serine peptidase [Verrucomicrobiales bacterium]